MRANRPPPAEATSAEDRQAFCGRIDPLIPARLW